MPPDTGEVAANLDRIINDCRRASEVFDSILILFRRNDQKQQPIDVNEIAFEVLQSSRGELAALGVTARTEFAPGLPLVERAIGPNCNRSFQIWFRMQLKQWIPPANRDRECCA